MLDSRCSTAPADYDFSPSPVVAPSRPSTSENSPRNAVAALLAPADVLLDLDVPTKRRALEEIARFVAERNGLPCGEVHANLVERERIGSTAPGFGMAIPHARLKGLPHPIAAFVRTKFPIPFDAPDDKPVSEMLVLLVPQQATDEHLRLLAEVAEMFGDRPFRERLRSCAQPADVHSAFTRWRT